MELDGDGMEGRLKVRNDFAIGTMNWLLLIQYILIAYYHGWKTFKATLIVAT